MPSAAVGARNIRELKSRIFTLYDSLARFDSLAPSPKLNALFGELVALTNAADDATARLVLADPHIAAIVPQLREICARGEAALEAHWAERIIGSRNPRRQLELFPYFANYVQLARLEIHALRGVSDIPLKRAVFIGSGPMPLSSSMLATRHGLQVDNLDIDGTATALGEGVAKATGLDQGQRFFCTDVHGYAKEDLYAADVVCVAALAGLAREQKAEIVAVLEQAMRPGALLMVRSADRLRGLLYPVIHADDMRGFTAEAVVHPLNDVVNSVLVLSKT